LDSNIPLFYPSRLHGRYIISRPISWTRHVQLKRDERLFIKRRPLKEVIDELVQALGRDLSEGNMASSPETYIYLDMKII
jgi:hypothetical protein